MTALLAAIAGAAGFIFGAALAAVACAYWFGRAGVCEHCVGRGQYEVD